MKESLLSFALVSILLWGLWGFLGKLAVQRIGLQASFWNALILILPITIYLLITKQLFPLKIEFWGISLALLAGLASGLASVLFYIFLRKNPAGMLVALTALYPLVTIILSVIFLKEPLTVTKIIGFILALAALFLLTF